MKHIKILSFLIVLVSIMPWTTKAQSTNNNNWKQHQISFLLSDIVFTRISLDYEQLIDNKGLFSIHIPASVALSPVSAIIDDEEMKFWVGLGLNIYPTGQGKFKYFLGPEMRYSLVDYTYSDFREYQYEDAQGNIIYEDKEYTKYIKDMSSLYFLVNNGLIYTPMPRFSVSSVFGLGIQSRLVDRYKLDYGNNILPAVSFSVRLGYKF